MYTNHAVFTCGLNAGQLGLLDLLDIKLLSYFKILFKDKQSIKGTKKYTYRAAIQLKILKHKSLIRVEIEHVTTLFPIFLLEFNEK